MAHWLINHTYCPTFIPIHWQQEHGKYIYNSNRLRQIHTSSQTSYVNYGHRMEFSSHFDEGFHFWWQIHNIINYKVSILCGNPYTEKPTQSVYTFDHSTPSLQTHTCIYTHNWQNKPDSRLIKQTNNAAYSLVTCQQQGISWSDSTGICYDLDALPDSDLLANNGIPSVSAYCVWRNPFRKTEQNHYISNNEVLFWDYTQKTTKGDILSSTENKCSLYVPNGLIKCCILWKRNKP